MIDIECYSKKFIVTLYLYYGLRFLCHVYLIKIIFQDKLQKSEASLKTEQESWSAEIKKRETQNASQEKEHKDSLQRLEEKIATLVRLM